MVYNNIVHIAVIYVTITHKYIEKNSTFWTTPNAFEDKFYGPSKPAQVLPFMKTSLKVRSLLLHPSLYLYASSVSD